MDAMVIDLDDHNGNDTFQLEVPVKVCLVSSSVWWKSSTTLVCRQ